MARYDVQLYDHWHLECLAHCIVQLHIALYNFPAHCNLKLNGVTQCNVQLSDVSHLKFLTYPVKFSAHYHGQYNCVSRCNIFDASSTIFSEL